MAVTDKNQIHLAALIDALPLGLIIVDHSCAPILTNRQLMRLLKYDSEQRIIDQIEKHFSLRNICREAWHRRVTLPPKEVQVGERFIRLFVTPILENNEPVGAVMLAEDVTDKKMLERTRDEFFAIASHELRTPLTAIRGNAELMLQYDEQRLDDPSVKEMVEDIRNSSVRLLLLVNDYLDASRLELGRIDFDITAADVTELIRSVVRELDDTAIAKGLELHVDIPADCPAAATDIQRTQQILVNLVGNAIKFTSQGSVTIRVAVNAADEMIEIRVIDTGVGILPKNRELLFQKFQQAGAKVLGRMAGGTGLGLYISKLLAKGMGGHLQLEQTELGKGSTFLLTLPIDA